MTTPSGTATFVPSTFTDLTRAQLLAELHRLGLGLAAASVNIADTAALVGQVATGGTVYTQPTPAATWTVPHTIGRLPSVTLYVAGEIVETDIYATTTSVTITFPTPTAGYAVLT